MIFICLPGNTPHRETVLEPGDLITHVTLAAACAGKPLALFKIARPRFLRIRARLRRGRGHGCKWKTDACSHRAWWSGHEALEVDRGRA